MVSHLKILSSVVMILSGFGAGEGPVLPTNVNCNENNTNLSECMHPEDIGLHNCEADDSAGVMCSEIISSETATTSPSFASLPAVIGGVVGALVVLIIAIIIVVILIVLVTRRRKEDEDIAGKKPGKKASAKCFTVLMY